jgi:large subunit ribosomal protein L2
MSFNPKRVIFRLSRSFKRSAGRNNSGKITVRHKVGGLKRRVRLFDFSHGKNLSGVFKSTVILPRKFSFASIFEHPDMSYTLLPSLNSSCTKLLSYTSSSLEIPSLSRNYVFTYLKFIKKVGLRCSNVQFSKNSKTRIASSPGTSIKILRQGYTSYIVRMPSGEIRHINPNSSCFLGQLKQPSLPTRRFRAGFSYLMGFRPSVRGVAINPVDHPHGGNTSPGKNSVSPWSKYSKAKYNFTRDSRKSSSSIIIYRRFIKKKF